MHIARREAAIALLGAWLLWTAVFDYPSARAGLVRGAPATAAGRLTLPLPLDRVPGARLVTVLQVTNRGAVPLTFDAAVDGQVLAHATIAPGARERVDFDWPRPASAPAGAPSEHVLELTGDHHDWQADAELANIFGSSRGLLNFVVVPVAQSVPRPPPFVVLAFAVLVLLGLPGHQLTASPRLAWAWRAPSWLFALTFGLVALAPLASRFRIGLEGRTFLLGALILLGPQALARLRRSPVASRVRSWASRPAVAVTLAAAAAQSVSGSAMAFWAGTFHGNASGVLHINRDVAARAPFLVERPDLADDLIVGDEGYDGQYMYLLAFDPFLQRFRDMPARYREVADLPPYRYGRIGFPVITRVLSGGRPDLFPTVMLWLVVAAHFGVAAMLAALAARQGWSPWLGLVYLTIPGFVSSLTFGLPESLAALGLVCGVYGWTVGRPWLIVTGFGASLLVRETGVILVMSLFAANLWTSRSKALGVALLAAVCPLVAWRLYVASRLFSDFGWSALFPSPGILDVPLAGIAGLWSAVLAGGHPSTERAAALTYPVLLVAACLLALVALRRQRSGLALAACAYGAVALSVNYASGWSHVPSTERTTYELPLCLPFVWCAAGTTSASQQSLRPVLRAFFVALGIYTLAWSPEAHVARAALLLIR